MSDRKQDAFDPVQVSENEIYRFLTTRALAQNQLLYSRVQTMLTVEAAAIAGSIVAPKPVLKLVVLALDCLLITIFWLLARRDRQAQLANLDLLDRVHKPLGISLIPPHPATGSAGHSASPPFLAVCSRPMSSWQLRYLVSEAPANLDVNHSFEATALNHVASI